MRHHTKKDPRCMASDTRREGAWDVWKWVEGSSTLVKETVSLSRLVSSLPPTLMRFTAFGTARPWIAQ